MCVTTGIRRIAFLLVTGAFAASVAGGALAADTLAAGSKALSAKSCVIASTDDMRRNHMEYLKHDRRSAVRLGDRSVTHSLAECVDCHAGRDSSGNALPVNGEGQFCAGCHEYTGVSVSCFQCHRKVPEEK